MGPGFFQILQNSKTWGQEFWRFWKFSKLLKHGARHFGIFGHLANSGDFWQPDGLTKEFVRDGGEQTIVKFMSCYVYVHVFETVKYGSVCCPPSTCLACNSSR